METTHAAAAIVCPNCGNPSQTSDYCANCSHPLQKQEAPAAAATRPVVTGLHGGGLADFLTVLAFGVLIMGLFGALWCWGEYGTITTGGMFGSELSVANPLARGVAVAIAANSVIWWALLVGVARTIHNTVELSRQIASLPRT